MIDAITKERNLKIRGYLASAILKILKEQKMTQTEMAVLLKTNQPRISHLLDGKIETFRIDTLVDYLTRLGVRVNITLE